MRVRPCGIELAIRWIDRQAREDVVQSSKERGMEDETRRPRLSHNYNLLKNRKAGFGPALYRSAEAFSLSDYCPHPSNQRRCCKIVLMFQNQSIQETLQGENRVIFHISLTLVRCPSDR